MKSVAFYSYKGGSGRSTACVNFTYFFAKEVNATPLNPIIIVDCDIDSAGLTYLLQKNCKNKDKFLSTFEAIRIEFKRVFREMFHGGEAELVLTDPDNLLETGIEIQAVPTGKNLKSISLLSGGEKTFTAISLLFAILNFYCIKKSCHKATLNFKQHEHHLLFQMMFYLIEILNALFFYRNKFFMDKPFFQCP